MGSAEPPARDGSRTFVVVLGALLVFAVGAVVVVAVLAVRRGNDADALQRALDSQRIAAASAAQNNGSPERAMLLALEAYRRVQHESLDRSYEARNALVTALERDERLRAVFRGAAPPSEIAQSPDKIALSPDGREFAVATTGYSSTSVIRIWDVARGSAIGRPIHTHAQETQLLFTNDGRTLVAAGYGRLDLFNARTGAEVGKSLNINPFFIRKGRRRYDSEFNAIVVSPDARFAFVAGTQALDMFDVAMRKPLFVATYDGGLVDACISERRRAVAFVNLFSGKTAIFEPSAKVRLPKFRAASVACTPDGRTFAFGTRGGVAEWDVARGVVTKRLRVPGTPQSLVFSRDGRRLAVRVRGGVLVWDLTRLTHAFVGAGGCCPSFSDDGRALVVADHVRLAKGRYIGQDRAVVWDLERGAAAGPPIEADLAACSTSAPRDTCVSLSDDAKVRLWDVGGREPLERAELPQAGVATVAFSPGGDTLYTGGDGGDVELLAVPSGHARGQLRDDADSVSKIAVSPDGRTLAVASAGVKLWDLRRNAIAGRLGGGATVAFSPDGRTIATGSDEGITFWDVSSRRRRGKPVGGSAYELSFSPDGKLLASIGDEGIELWDVDKRTQIARAVSPNEHLGFSPKTRLVVAASSTSMQFWNVDDHQLVTASPLLSLPGYRNVVGISPDGAVVASGSEDGSVRLWDAARRAQLGQPLYAGDSISDLAIGSGGTIATAVGKHVELWDGLLASRDYDAWRGRICGVVRMSLSRAEWREFIGSERYQRTCS